MTNLITSQDTLVNFGDYSISGNTLGTKNTNEDIIKYVNTWDNYGLSVLFINLVGNIVRVFSLKNCFFSKWLNILTKNIHSNPLMRESLKDTMEKYENLYDENENWSQINNHLDKDKMTKLYKLISYIN